MQSIRITPLAHGSNQNRPTSEPKWKRAHAKTTLSQSHWNCNKQGRKMEKQTKWGRVVLCLQSQTQQQQLHNPSRQLGKSQPVLCSVTSSASAGFQTHTTLFAFLTIPTLVQQQESQCYPDHIPQCKPKVVTAFGEVLTSHSPGTFCRQKLYLELVDYGRITLRCWTQPLLSDAPLWGPLHPVRWLSLITSVLNVSTDKSSNETPDIITWNYK